MLTRWRAQRRLTFDTRTRTKIYGCQTELPSSALSQPRIARCCCPVAAAAAVAVAPLQHVHALSQTHKTRASSFLFVGLLLPRPIKKKKNNNNNKPILILLYLSREVRWLLLYTRVRAIRRMRAYSDLCLSDFYLFF